MSSMASLASRFATAGLMACTLAIYADTAIWTNDTAAIDHWTNTTNWVDENGDNLALPPTNHRTRRKGHCRHGFHSLQVF